MFKSQLIYRQKPLPNLPPAQTDAEILGVSPMIMRYISKYCNMETEVDCADTNCAVYLDIVGLLVIRDDNKQQLRVASRYIMNAGEAFSHYAEMLLE